MEEPHWIELHREGHRAELDRRICEFMLNGTQIKHPTVVIAILNKESNYAGFKDVMLKYNIPSQVVTMRNAR